VKVTYVGLSDQRVVQSADFPDLEDDFADIIWGPGETRFVPDSVGEFLLRDRDFRAAETHETTPEEKEAQEAEEAEEVDQEKPLEEMTRDELYELASDMEIKGRSSMTREELIEAIEEYRASE
jgi:Rho termination factor, N-terminal domain